MGTANLLPLALAPGLHLAATDDPTDYLHQAVLGAGRGAEWPAQAFPVAIQRVGIVGAGAMGIGISRSFLDAGIAVVLLDCSAQALEQGQARLREAFETARRKGRLIAPEMAERMALLQPTLAWKDLATCDWVIETVYENLALKQEVMTRLGRVCKPGAVIASNTSTLDLDILAHASGRPQDVVGMHFLAPAHVRPLVEVVRGAASSARSLFVAREVARLLRRIPVQSSVGFGFTGNRMLDGMLREADFLLMEGVSPQRVDRALEEFGFATGPCRMMDLIGLDVCHQVLTERTRALRPVDHPAYRRLTRRLHALGRLGQKSGCGYYRYQGRQALPDAAVGQLAAALAERHGVVRRRSVNDDEIVRRCLYPLVNEGLRLLAEGRVQRASDIDLIWTYGYGFPQAKGGPMHWASRLAEDTLESGMRAFARRFGDNFGYWTPAAQPRGEQASARRRS
ncbi:MAG: hypothetical protein A2040_17315 [Rhodocyclales bacterium GWA2_65_19]|nr:MAG: hypothetical protein A2040_17315 [Rhodocyclales bacterium GWA2_65_19]